MLTSATSAVPRTLEEHTLEEQIAAVESKLSVVESALGISVESSANSVSGFETWKADDLRIVYLVELQREKAALRNEKAELLRKENILLENQSDAAAGTDIVILLNNSLFCHQNLKILFVNCRC